jgi:hypothetical protein
MSTSVPSGPDSTRGRSLYLYAIADANTAVPEGLTGLGDAPVESLPIGRLNVVVSPIANTRLRPERRHLAAHQGVLRSMMNISTVLPVGFGMIVNSKGKLLSIIQNAEHAFLEQLDEVRGRVEMSLRVSWDVPNIFQFFIENESDLRAARDAMINNGSPHAAKVALGQMFEKLIAQRRDDHAARVVNALEGLAQDLLQDAPKSDSEVLRISALVDRASLDAFEARVHEVATTFDTSYRFDYSGPWAPHNFVKLDLEDGLQSKAA